jgi:hypothetical protein
MNKFLSTMLAVTAFASLTACASQDATDEFASEETNDNASDAGKADVVSAAGTYTYYTVTADTRRCVSPLCGGFWFQRVNRSTTICHDGSVAQRCYVAQVDLSPAGLPPKAGELLHGALVVRGRFSSKLFGSFGKLGTFGVTEAWRGTFGVQPQGVFVRVKDNGIRCITTPCGSLTERKLNSSLKADIADVDFTPAGLSDSDLEIAVGSLSEGIIVAGDRFTVSEGSRRAKGRTATAVYTKVLGSN